MQLKGWEFNRYSFNFNDQKLLIKAILSMKKLLLLPVLLAVCRFSAAQTASSSVAFGIKAGSGFSNYLEVINGHNLNNRFIVAYQGGAYINIAFSKAFSFQPSLLYAAKGGKSPLTITDVGGSPVGSGESKTSLSYLEVPLNIIFKPGKFFVGIGPYLGYGIDGKMKILSDYYPDTYTMNIFKRDSSGHGDLKRFDMGVNAIFGYELTSHFNISVNGEWGLLNLLIHPVGETYSHNIAFGVCLGYTFTKRSTIAASDEKPSDQH